VPEVSKYWAREHFYDLPSTPTVDAVARAVTPTDNVAFADYTRNSLNRWSMTDELFLNQQPDKHHNRTYAQQLYGF
jgi:hypothetical protein